MTLDEAIEQLVNLGEKDPITIARKIKTQNELEWLTEQFLALDEDIISERARQRIGAVRRGAEVALRPGDQMASSKLKLVSSWVPGIGYKRASDLTPADLRDKATWYDNLAFAATRRAMWCRDVADQIETEGVKTLGRLKAALPPLPEREFLAELEAA